MRMLFSLNLETDAFPQLLRYILLEDATESGHISSGSEPFKQVHGVLGFDFACATDYAGAAELVLNLAIAELPCISEQLKLILNQTTSLKGHGARYATGRFSY